MHRIVPQAVHKAFSPQTKALMDERYQSSTTTLAPHIQIAPSLSMRIRGLKPTPLYATYTILNSVNVLEPMFEVAAEEAQTAWALKAKSKALTTNPYLLKEKAAQEFLWLNWEDEFMTASNPPPLPQPQFYIDIMDNTYMHMLAYATANRQLIDITEFNRQFEAANFATSNQMYIKNALGHTPLVLLMNNPQLYEFVESLLLNLPPENRFIALPLNYWQSSWGTLTSITINDHIETLISESKIQENFLQKFLNLTFSNTDALLHLFSNGYKISHGDFYVQTQTSTLIPIFAQIPDWHNLTVVLYYLFEKTQVNQHYSNLKDVLRLRGKIIQDEIASIVYHPARIAKLLAAGHMPGTFDTIM